MAQVLLVHPDADVWLDAHADLAPSVTTAPSAREARAYLAGTAFDVVYVGPNVEGSEAIGALRDVLGLGTPIEHLIALDDLTSRLSGPTGGGGTRSKRWMTSPRS